VSESTVGLLNPTAEDILFPYNSGPGFLLRAGKVTQVPAEVVGLILRKHSHRGVCTLPSEKAAEPAPTEALPVEETPAPAPEAPKETKKARRPGKARR
jgi:hypothetical protein